MSAPERNGISRDEVEGKIRGETKLFHEETDIKCFVILYSDEWKINNSHTTIVFHDKNSIV
jgi:hypothetical protein